MPISNYWTDYWCITTFDNLLVVYTYIYQYSSFLQNRLEGVENHLKYKVIAFDCVGNWFLKSLLNSEETDHL